MYIPQTDLFWGLNQTMVNRIMGIAQRIACKAGDTLFVSDDPANALYILAQGEVKVITEEPETHVYTGRRVGEAFGWGCLIGRDTYGARAECASQVVVLKLDAGKLLKMLDDDLPSGYLFFKHLSRTLGGRLMQAYRQMAGDPSV